MTPPQTSSYQLRDYQANAVQATIEHFRKTNAPAVIVLPTGAGKSLVIADLCRQAKGDVICLAHVKELVEQNHKKFLATGATAGIFSAGLGKKHTEQKTTFASVQSMAPNIDAFQKPISLLIIDECHRVSLDENSQYQQIIHHLRAINPELKVLGLTATPYRLGSGWIYQQHYYGFVRTAEPRFFKTCIFDLSLRYMIKHGYLTKPTVFDAAIAHYDFSKLMPSSDPETEKHTLNSLISKHPRVTQAIIEQIIELSHDRQGVMIFAATIHHAEEIMGYLKGLPAAFIQGETPPKERDITIQAFKKKNIKYLVNVSVLTTGFDAPHVDVIALLRPTESVSLFQQIVGRGLRLADNKDDCLILDYTNSGYDIFAPEIGEKKPSTEATPVQVNCPECNFSNTFWGKKDEAGHVYEHYGRRCHGLLYDDTQCTYRFRFKLCPQCQMENDIAARQCQHCEHFLIDADELLKKALNLKDSKVLRCAGVKAHIKDQQLEIVYFDEDGSELKERLNLNHKPTLEMFNQSFGKRLLQGQHPVVFSTIEEVSPFLVALPHPDFVIARKQKHYWKVSERIFDYEGHYRKANALN